MSNSYTDIFTGSPVQPSDVSYTSYTLTESITLVWPQTGLETDNIVARIIDISSSSSSYTITMPDATQVSVGQDVLFRNLGAQDITIKKNDGTTLVVVQASPDPNANYIYLTNNSTAAGTWGVVNYGTGTSSADAATLAGYGLQAITTTLNVDMSITNIPESGTNYNVTTADRGQLLVWDSGNGTVTLPSAASVGNGFIFSINNASDVGGEIEIVPDGSDTIDTFQSNYPVSILESLSLVSNGQDGWHSLGFGKETIFAVNILNLDLAGRGSEYTLSDIEASKLIIKFTGTLTENITIFFPPTANQYYIDNDVTAPTSFTVTITTTGGSLSYVIPEGQRYIYYCDGTDLYSIPTTVAPGSLTLPDNPDPTEPSINFDNDPETGIYHPGAGEFGIATSGVASAIFTALGIEIAENGDAANPSITWSGSTTSGLFLDTVNSNVSMTYGGATVALFDVTGIETTVGTVSSPSYSFMGRSNDGIYSPANDQIAIASGGNQVFNITPTTATFATTLILPAGTSSAPSVAFTGDLNTGIFRSADNIVSFVSNGSEQVTIGDTYVTLKPNVSLRFDDGSSNYFDINIPSLATDIDWTLPNAEATVNGQPLVSSTAGVLSWATSSFDANGIKVPNGAASTPSLSFTNASTWGMYYDNSDTKLRITAAATDILEINTTDVVLLNNASFSFTDNELLTGYVTFRAAATVTDQSYILPTAVPTANGQPLISATSGAMSWATTTFDSNGIKLPAGSVPTPPLSFSADNTSGMYSYITGGSIKNLSIICNAMELFKVSGNGTVPAAYLLGTSTAPSYIAFYNNNNANFFAITTSSSMVKDWTYTWPINDPAVGLTLRVTAVDAVAKTATLAWGA
jgi:hypothetical protein